MTFLNNKNKKANESNIWTASLLRLDCIIYRQFNRRLPCDYHMQMSEWENRRESIEKLDVFHIIQINNWNVKVTKMRSSIPCGFHLIWIFKHTKFSHKRKGGGGWEIIIAFLFRFLVSEIFQDFQNFHLTCRRGGWHLAGDTWRMSPRGSSIPFTTGYVTPIRGYAMRADEEIRPQSSNGPINPDARVPITNECIMYAAWLTSPHRYVTGN